MKVKVYNTKEWIETETDGKYSTFREHNHAIICGPKGKVFTCSEGVHFICKNDAEELQIEIVTPSETGGIKIMPEAIIKTTIGEMLEKCPVMEEKELGEYIRKFGTRLESNYNILLKSLKEIGLNPKDYPREV